MKKKQPGGGNLKYLRKMMRIMKLSLFLIVISTALAFSATSYSQSTKLTLDLNAATVKEVLKAIESKSEFLFFYQEKHVDLNRQVTLHVTNQDVETILNQLFAGTNNIYVINDRQVVIGIAPRKELEKQILSLSVNVKPVIEQPQQKEIAGKVTDIGGLPLPGVTVVVKGTTIGTISGNDGNFSLQVPLDANTLAFSFVGMKSQEIELAGRTNVNVIMEEESLGIEEVVAIGYGTMRKSDLTGAVIRADINAFRESANVNLLQSLQGTTPGLNIGMVDEAGENPSISIRGRTTLSGNQDLLIVVDGIIYNGSFSDFNSDDIESIDILKDASSKAIYGAQAANGVIIITTKMGKVISKPVLTYTTSYSTVSPLNRLAIKNREQHLDFVRDVFWEKGYTASSGYTQENPDFDFEPAVVSPENVVGLREGTDTDWYDLATNKGNIQQHKFNVTGKSDKISYFISAGYDKQKNWIINDHFNRKTARINIENEIAKWLKVGANSFGAFSDYSGSSPNLNGIAMAGPLRSPYAENGELVYLFESISNPLVPVARDDYDKRNSLFGNIYGEINAPFISGLTYKINFGNNLRWNKNYYSDIYARSMSGEANKFNSSEYDYTLDNIVNYKKILNNRHSFDITLVAGISERSYESTSALSYSISNQLLGYNSLEQGAEQYNYSDSWEEASSYQMGRLNYNLSNKYILTGTIRRDGFSGFAKNEKTAYFPSIAMAWIIINEKFMEGNSWLSNLKFRASWGVNGNLVGRYSSLATVSSGAAYVFGDGGTTKYGHSPTSLGSPFLKWEKTNGLNFGLDYGLFKGAIYGSLEYYNTGTHDLIWDRSLPSITGFNSILGNIGEVRNNGFEMLINATPLNTNKLSWDLIFAFSINKNMVTHLLGDRTGDGIEDDLITSGLFIGEPVGAVYHYEIEGIYQIGDDIPAGYQVGTYKIVDQQVGENGTPDGVINANDRIILGQTSPAYRFSIQNELKYKNFIFKVFLNSIQGGRNSYLGVNEPNWLDTPYNAAKHGTFVDLDYWTPSNTDALYSHPGTYGSINPVHYFSRSFIRLQDISLAYNFGKRLNDKFGVGRLKLYVSGKNLYTWTKWQGWDPETNSGMSRNGRPVMKNYTLGLEVTF